MPIGDRFRYGAAPVIPVVDVTTLPSGYAQSIGGYSVVIPVPAIRDPAVGNFLRGADIPAEAIGGGMLSGYAKIVIDSDPTWSGAIGRMAIGRAHIGRIGLKMIHRTIVPVVINGYTVYQEQTS